jgi:hypothetical protein
VIGLLTARWSEPVPTNAIDDGAVTVTVGPVMPRLLEVAENEPVETIEMVAAGSVVLRSKLLLPDMAS